MKIETAFHVALLLLLAIAAAAAVLLSAAATRGDELAECRRLAPKYQAETEARQWDDTRVDLLTPTHAIEADWPRKWAEAIGQALYYAELTGKRPGIVLLISDPAAEARYVYRCQTVCAKHGITLYIEPVAPTPAFRPADLPGPLRDNLAAARL